MTSNMTKWMLTVTSSQYLSVLALSVLCACLSLLLYRLICAKLEHSAWKTQLRLHGLKVAVPRRRNHTRVNFRKVLVLTAWSLLTFVYPEKVIAVSLIQEPTRYVHTTEDGIECFYVNRGVEHMSAIVIREHGLSPKDFAVSLQRAAIWFQDVGNGKISQSEKQPPFMYSSGRPKTLRNGTTYKP